MMHNQARRTSGRDAAVPRPLDRPLPRPPGSRGSRPPATSPAHHVAESPLPRPPGDPRRPAISPEHYDDTDRPLRRPPGDAPAHRAAENHAPRRSPGDPIASPGEHHDDDTERRPLRRPPGDHHPAAPIIRPPPSYYYQGSDDHVAPRRASSALASCLAATAFLLLAAGGAGAALFLLFRPRPPDIAVAAVRLPAFAAGNGTVAFTFEQTAIVRNPNRSPLSHFDSSLRVAYAGGELGYVYIPAGLIDGGRAKDMSASFDVPAFPAAFALSPQQQTTMVAAAAAAPPVMEVDSLLLVKGRITMLRVLTHRVQAAKVCRVAVSPVDGRVLGFRC